MQLAEVDELLAIFNPNQVNPILNTNELNPPPPPSPEPILIPNPNPLTPSWSLVRYALAVGNQLQNLNNQRTQLLEIIGHVNQSVQDVNSLNLALDLQKQLTNTVTQIADVNEHSGQSLASVLREACLLVCDSSLTHLANKIYNLGWRGVLAIPFGITGNVLEDFEDFITAHPGVSTALVELSLVQPPPQQNQNQEELPGGPND